MPKSELGYVIVMEGVGMEAAEARVREALAAQGFGVLTEIDVKATLKKKLDVEHAPYRILGACNPKLAHKAIGIDPKIGLLLPCNVVVREVEGGTEVAIIDPGAMFAAVDLPGLDEIAEEAEARLKAVAAALG